MRAAREGVAGRSDLQETSQPPRTGKSGFAPIAEMNRRALQQKILPAAPVRKQGTALAMACGLVVAEFRHLWRKQRHDAEPVLHGSVGDVIVPHRGMARARVDLDFASAAGGAFQRNSLFDIGGAGRGIDIGIEALAAGARISLWLTRIAIAECAMARQHDGIAARPLDAVGAGHRRCSSNPILPGRCRWRSWPVSSFSEKSPSKHLAHRMPMAPPIMRTRCTTGRIM